MVVGAGIGGLACAQGLVQRGLDVQVMERDADLAMTGGYKLHLGAPAVLALRKLLPATSFEALLGSSVGTPGFSLTVRDHRGRRLLQAREASPGLSLDVDRITLRHILALGLDDRMIMGRSCQGWRVVGETIVAELDDGTEVEADVLVIADGAGSKLAEQLAGRPTSFQCGLTGVAGRTLWSSLPDSTTALLRGGPLLAIGPGGTGLFAAAHDPAGRAAIYTTHPLASAAAPVAIWGLIAIEQALPRDPEKLPHVALVDASVRVLRRRRWAEPLIDLLTRSNTDSVSAFKFNAADPEDLAPWKSSRVTAIGDAVHAMPPTGGQGAATAIIDADVLTERLHAAERGEATLVVAAHDSENDLRTRAAPVVRESLQPVDWIRASASPTGAFLLRTLNTVFAVGSAAARTAAQKWRR